MSLDDNIDIALAKLDLTEGLFSKLFGKPDDKVLAHNTYISKCIDEINTLDNREKELIELFRKALGRQRQVITKEINQIRARRAKLVDNIALFQDYQKRAVKDEQQEVPEISKAIEDSHSSRRDEEKLYRELEDELNESIGHRLDRLLSTL